MRGEYFYQGVGYQVSDVLMEKHFARYILVKDNNYLVISERIRKDEPVQPRPVRAGSK